MTPKIKIFLPVTGFIFLLMTSLAFVRPAMASPFGEAFGSISNYSKIFNTGRYYRATRRRRAIRKRLARKRYALRRRYYARRRRATIRARYRNIRRARSIRRARARRNIQVRKRARLARRRQIKRQHARVVQRRIAQKQYASQRQARQLVVRKRQARIRQQRAASRRIVHQKKQARAGAKFARSRRIALADLRPIRKPVASQKRKAVKPLHSVQASHKPKLLEQARSSLTYAVQGKVPGLDRAGKKGVQLALSRAGFYGGAADGLFGPQTRRAIRDYQKSLGQYRTGHLDSVQLSSLLWAVSRNATSGNSYLPEGQQKSLRQEKIRKQAKLLAERSQLPVGDEAVPEPKKVSFIQSPTRRKAKPFIALKPKKLEQQARLEAGPKNNKNRLSALPRTAQGNARQASLSSVDRKAAQKAAQKVDYVHTLGRTRHGEALWVVKCIDKKQLRLYFWRDKQWWVRGKDGGSVGFSEYGSGGIKNLASKVCTL